MKGMNVAVAALLAGLGLATAGGVPASAQFIQYGSARNYLAAGVAVRDGYVAGLLDSLYVHGLMPRNLYDCTATMRLGQIREIFDTWLRNHPTQQSFSLPSTFTIALEQSCR